MWYGGLGKVGLTSSPRRVSHWWVSGESHSDSAWGYHLFEEWWCGRVLGIVSIREERRMNGVAFLIPNKDFRNLKEMQLKKKGDVE